MTRSLAVTGVGPDRFRLLRTFLRVSKAVTSLPTFLLTTQCLTLDPLYPVSISPTFNPLDPRQAGSLCLSGVQTRAAGH